MSFLSRIKSILTPSVRGGSLENPSTPFSAAFDDFGESFSNASGIAVSRKQALSYAAVWRAVNMISRDIAKIPLLTYLRTDEGKDRHRKHQSYNLLRRKSNPFMTAFAFKQTLQASVLLNGNGYAWIDRDQKGTPVGLYPLSADATNPVNKAGIIVYQLEALGRRYDIPASDIMHIKGLGYDGYKGYSVIEFASLTLGAAIGSQRYGASFFKNAARPSSVLEHPGVLTDEAAKRLQAGFKAMYSGVDNAHKTIVLEEAMKLTPISINAKDSQLIESRAFDVREVANIFGVPPHKLGDTTRTAYASLEQENQSYLDDALDGWMVAWEEECTDKLVSEVDKENDTVFCEFLRAALVRADIKTRYEAYNIGINAGFLSGDDVRLLENMNVIPDGQGKHYRFPLNMASTPQPPTPTPKRKSSRLHGDLLADDQADVKRANIIQDLRKLMADTLCRMVGRLVTHARRHAEKNPRWIEQSMQEEHGAVVMDSVGSVVSVAHRLDMTLFSAEEIAEKLFVAIRTFAKDASSWDAMEEKLKSEVRDEWVHFIIQEKECEEVQ